MIVKKKNNFDDRIFSSTDSETLDDFDTMIEHNAEARKRDKKSKYCSFEQYKIEINEYIERRAKELGIQN